MGEGAEHGVVAKLVVVGQGDPVLPRRGLGGGRAHVGDAPGDLDGGARLGRGGHGHGGHHQVGGRALVEHLDGHRVEVVGLVALGDRVVLVELDEDGVGAFEAPGHRGRCLAVVVRGGVEIRVAGRLAEQNVVVVAVVLVEAEHGAVGPRGHGGGAAAVEHSPGHGQDVAGEHAGRHDGVGDNQVGQGEGEVEGVGVGGLAKRAVAVLVHLVVHAVADVRPDHKVVGARRGLRGEGNPVVSGVDALGRRDADRAVRPREGDVAGREREVRDGLAELDGDAAEGGLERARGTVGEDNGRGVVDVEAAGVDVLGQLAVGRVAVLVHRHAGHVVHVGADGEAVVAGDLLCGQLDAVGGACHIGDHGGAEAALGAVEEDIYGGERAERNGLAEGHVHLGHRGGDRGGRRVGDDEGAGGVDGERGLVAVLGLAQDAVVVLVHHVAAGVGDLRPDEGGVVALGSEGVEGDPPGVALDVGDAGDRDAAVGAEDAHIGRAEAGGQNGHREGDVEVAHGESDQARGVVAEDADRLDVEVERARVAVVLDAVLVLVHGVAGQVGHRRPYSKGIGAVGGLPVEADAELCVGERGDRQRLDAAAWPRDGHVAGGEAGRRDRLGEGHINVVHGAVEGAERRLGGDAGAGLVELDGRDVDVVAWLLANPVAVLVEAVARLGADARPDRHLVGAFGGQRGVEGHAVDAPHLPGDAADARRLGAGH